MPRKSTTALISLLTQERTMLKTGALQHLSDIRTEKEAAITMLEKLPPEAEELDEILTLARRNAVMLEAVIAGVEAARQSIAAGHGAQRSLTSYSASGQARELAEHRHDLEHKA